MNRFFQSLGQTCALAACLLAWPLMAAALDDLPCESDPALQAGMEVNSEWWTLFHDPVLNRLVQMAYEQNLSLQAAGLRIMQARAQLGIAIGSQYPQVQEAAGAVTRQNLSENIPNFNPAADTSYWTANAGLNASWELDFWGKYRRIVEAADADPAVRVIVLRAAGRTWPASNPGWARSPLTRGPGSRPLWSPAHGTY